MTDSNTPEIPPPPAPSERSENADDRQVIQPYVDPEVLAEDARAAERRKHERFARFSSQLGKPLRAGERQRKERRPAALLSSTV